jgi:transposase InsO family protein
VTVSRPAVLQAGDKVRLGGRAFTVTAVSARMVELVDVTGAELAVPLADLFGGPGFAVVTGRRPAPLPPQGLLAGLPEEVAETARWWERHIVEVVTGLPVEGGPGAVVRPEHAGTLRQREIAKVAELRGLGHGVSLRTLQRLRRGYEIDGVWGLVDHRFARQPSVTGRVDGRVVDAVRQAVAEQTSRSTGTVGRLRRRAEQILAAEQGLADAASVMPSRATFYRLVERVSAGKHTLGSARTRRSLAKRPDGPFGTVAALRPGEWMQVDSTPVDVRVVLDNGLVDRAELTWMIDLATRSIPAAVLRPTTKTVDAALLLARALTPEPMRPGWAEALRMARSVLPHRRLVELDERLEHAAARPVIVPETIVCDHGMVYVSQAFRSACRAMGVNFQATHKGSPWEKGAVERSFDSLGTLFAQHVAGYVGSSVERRGENAERDAVWSILELQDLLDEWIVAVWQNRPHDGLRHPLTPGRALTPNEMYAALVETTGYVPVPLSNEDYIELLSLSWRAINAYGVKINNRRYDCQALNPYRHQHSGLTARKGLWEVRHDPYDVSQVWVRNHHDGGWITVGWTHLKTTPVPFGELAWDHARKLLARRGEDPVTEQEIAAAATALLDKVEQGPAGADGASRKDQRVAGRARATARARPLPPRQPAEPREEAPPAEDDSRPVAKVIPLGIYDPFEEATKRW